MIPGPPVTYSHLPCLACASFGRFKPEFLLDLYAKVDQYLQDSGKSSVDQPDTSAPVTANDASDETVVMSNNLPGGLLRPNKSSNTDEVRFYNLVYQQLSGGLIFMQSRPIFKAPVARASLLGLDKLAQQKRDAEAAKSGHAPKKVKLDYTADGDIEEQEIESDIGK